MAGTSADYSQASYAQTADQGPSLYPDAASILHRPGYDYDHAVGIRRCPPRDVDEHREVAGGAFEAIVELASGQEAMLLIEAAAAGVFRIRFGASGSSYHETSDMLADPPPPVPEHGLIVEEHPSRYRLRLGGHSLCLDRNGFGLCLLREDGSEIFRIETTTHAGKHCGGPLGFRLPPGSRPQPYLGWRIANGERFFGLGEKWNACEKTGTTATIWSNDTAGSNTTDLSYKAVPVLFSTRGWGLFLHDYHRSRWEVGSFSYVAGTVLTEGPVLDCFLIAGDDLPAVQRRFTGLTGRPQMPPKWAFGTWVSRCQYDDAQTAQWAMQGMRSRGIPADVIHLDPKWMHVHWYWRIGVDACDFVWNEDGFPDHEALFRDWAADGWSVSLWINPYLPEGEPIYEEAREQGFLLRDERGGIARLSHGEAVGMVDFTHPAAREWWQGHCEAVLRAGAAVLKPDYGDRVPETALAHDGSSGRELHNRYLHLYAETAYHAAAAVHGRGIVWRRGGWVGTQRYPGTWAGDTQT
ncbi:MAG: TIM-barrel domain-containing protein, partial [Planctomycetota bacterium]